ncbi:hypothetical protein JTE90_023172 [Oedothorax gibbosus]|uniref:Uncharacterized protein n=1 Tax=Oedothorax gibbosus TaxID=931172 RepID=A0AAV6UHZ6_9ARAC|nr:hypothetical protein JTE90_023172 [Oedothorax gibbosus]
MGKKYEKSQVKRWECSVSNYKDDEPSSILAAFLKSPMSILGCELREESCADSKASNPAGLIKPVCRIGAAAAYKVIVCEDAAAAASLL